MRMCSLALLGLLALAAQGQLAARDPGDSATLPVLMLSDIHFDPLHDPEKVRALSKAPVAGWNAILDAAPSPDQPERFPAVQNACSAKDGDDSSYALLRSSLDAAKRGRRPAFVTVSGDLLVHDLDCRYRAALGMPANMQDDQSDSAAFAVKTTVFVMQQIETAFPRVPVYFALGNNDSRCNHNRLDMRDPYLSASVPALLHGLRGATPADLRAASQTYQSAGYYSVALPRPLQSVRLVVLNNTYMMPKFASCRGDSSDHAGDEEQTAWLQQQLNKARSTHQHVWIMGHLPPAVNVDASIAGSGSFCKAGKVVRFQRTDTLAEQIAGNADIVSVGIFGHTHMDELHLVKGPRGTVPIKVVASVTPVSGNLPSFTVAAVNRKTGVMVDYEVFKASNPRGAGELWSREYAFSSAYGEPDASAASMTDLVMRLQRDTAGISADSEAFRERMLKGAGGKKISSSWKAYTCGLDHVTAEAFKACVCRQP